MTMIRLHRPQASSARLERVHMFAGRHLGEEEFDRIQDYTDARLTALLKGAPVGIVQGLEVIPDEYDRHDGDFSVNPGFAVAGNGQLLGLYQPLKTKWQTLIDDYLAGTDTSDATGIYYLMVRRSSGQIDSAEVLPCQRAEFDPSRDSRLVVLGELKLRRLAIDPGAVAGTPREQIENWIAADRVNGGFLRNLENAVPLALLAIQSTGGDEHRVIWLSPEAGRYEAVADSGYRVLLNQVSAALRRVMQGAETALAGETPPTLSEFLQNNLHLDYLPATGQLPLSWLENPASTTPNLLWLPEHLGIDMVPVPEEAVLELVNRHLARRVIDLRYPAKDKIRLLLAVNEPDYRADLLDIPQTDSQLEKDIYRYHLRSYNAWLKYRRKFDRLYFLREESALEPEQIKSLGLPDPEDPPALAESIFSALIARATTELTDPQNPGTPYPYSKGVPTRPEFYTNWLVDGAPPPVPEPAEDGLVVQYAVGLVKLEAIENQVRALRTRLEKTRDYLLLQRQQLDSHTVALAALAGGVAGDGAGLQVARWLPFTKMSPRWAQPPASTDDSGGSGDQGGSTPQSMPVNPKGSTGTMAPMMMAQPMMSLPSMSAPPASPQLNLVEAQQWNAPGVKSLVSEDTFDRSLLRMSANTSKSVASGIKNRPFTASAFELNLNQSRLQLLAKLPKQMLTRPAFEAKEYRFGVMDHISPEVNEYAKAYRAMAELISTLDGLFDPAEAKSIKAQLRKVGTLKTPEEVESLPPKTSDAKTDKINLVQARYSALFEAGQILTKQIAIIEARYNALETKLERKLREHVDQQALLKKLSAQINAAREALEGIDGHRVEQLGDYGVAQRLLDEDWNAVYEQYKERARVLTTGVLGLYYVRVRGTPISTALADPLELRHGSSSDIVPGCDWREDVELPEELDDFFDAVCEVPMSDWTPLRGLVFHIPYVRKYNYLSYLRRSRFKGRPVRSPAAHARGSLQSRLATLHQQTQIVMGNWSTVYLPQFMGSIRRTQADAAKVLSLEDMSAMASSRLRKPAHELREKLEMCQYCLVEKLELLPPSLRLQWAQLAEDDRLRVEEVASWPGLEKAERDDFQATRTLAELVAWWFRQLAPKASRNGRSAMRNMIRATVIYAALGDPSEIVRGTVHVPPRVSAIGERLQVKLNRAPAPGTQLQLLDNRQRVVAMLAVEDHSAKSTQVKIVNLIHRNARINTRFSVVANRRTMALRGR